MQNKILSFIDNIFFQTKFIKSDVIIKDKQYVYFANHQFFMDHIISNGIIIDDNKNYLAIIATNYAKYVPLLGYNMTMNGHLFAGNEKRHSKDLYRTFTKKSRCCFCYVSRRKKNFY